MKRRDFLLSMAMFATTTRHASAQQAGARMKRVAMIDPSTKPDDMRIGGNEPATILFEEMKRFGYVEGVNLIVDRYSAEGRSDRYPEIARSVVATRPDVIFAITNSLVLALQSETRTIPIVAWTSGPVVGGIVTSLARPGGNITGVSVDAGAEFGAKRIEILTEAVGKLSNVRVLASPANWENPSNKALLKAAEQLNIPLRLEPLIAPVNEAEYRRAFEVMERDQIDGVMIFGDPVNYTHRVLVGRLAQQYHRPAISVYSDSVDAGALMSYGFDPKSGARRIAAQIVEILNGGNPAEMPFFQETHFELIINLKAAKELGLEISAALFARADRVIE